MLEKRLERERDRLIESGRERRVEAREYKPEQRLLLTVECGLWIVCQCNNGSLLQLTAASKGVFVQCVWVCAWPGCCPMIRFLHSSGRGDIFWPASH